MGVPAGPRLGTRRRPPPSTIGSASVQETVSEENRRWLPAGTWRSIRSAPTRWVTGRAGLSAPTAGPAASLAATAAFATTATTATTAAASAAAFAHC